MMKKALNTELINMITEKEAKRDKHLALAAACDAELKPLYELRSRAQNGSGAASESPVAGEKTGRALLPKWSDILRHIGATGDTTLDDMKSYADSKGYGLTKDNIRFQAYNYKKRGWLDRVSDGVFSLTKSGAQKCGYNDAFN